MRDGRVTILVTGANGTLGSAMVREIVKSPSYSSSYYGLYTVRDLSSASSLRTSLARGSNSSQHDSDVIPLDLSRLASVREAAADINSRVSSGAIPPIRALILNAGFQENFTQSSTGDGFDMTFQVNYLGHFLLALLLLGSMDKKEGRILYISSWTHDPDDTRNYVGPGAVLFPKQYLPIFRDGIDPVARGTWSTPAEDPSPLSGIRRYGASKLCLILIMLAILPRISPTKCVQMCLPPFPFYPRHELQLRLDRDPGLASIRILGLDPGGMPSDILRRASFMQRVVVNKIAGNLLAPIMTWLSPNGILRTPAKSANDGLSAVFGDVATLSSSPRPLYLNGSEVTTPSKDATDPRNAALLWGRSLAYAAVKEGETSLADWQ
ncbi:hypothetical protein FQN49_002509 [Arthroderma sp. PD_2]|nr:hypothetical protein FQN49_002509 [Arthroderma sp. PD_2]